MSIYFNNYSQFVKIVLRTNKKNYPGVILLAHAQTVPILPDSIHQKYKYLEYSGTLSIWNALGPQKSVDNQYNEETDQNFSLDYRYPKSRIVSERFVPQNIQAFQKTFDKFWGSFYQGTFNKCDSFT
eukprot:TRINITY_DN5638_c0_g1_i15.p7 TRINITY_DN5638_c0_g1~~TRINITY_DN5638_c0_g1_i15.p7  ORF type:complete len:127 (+),score=3.87 TRINITY_DN5638_c0_g1_i15:1521-1901(+)